MRLRPYQSDITAEVRLWWELGHKVVCVQLCTGGGKTPILSDLIDHHAGFVCAIAHRDKLVEQISLTLARAGIRHDLIASEKTKRIIAKKHVKKLGQCFYVPGARCRVASIDTLVRAKGIASWAAQVTLWVVDEAHHLLRANKWGRGIDHFTHPGCRGLMLTATPGRPDGKGLGSHADGLADALVTGPPMRWLIEEGYLCDYDVACPPTDLVALDAPRGSDGDFTRDQRLEAERASHIVGDIPEHYLRLAPSKSGITFCGSVETAVSTVGAFRARGVPAELITGDTDPTVRDNIFEKAERGEILQIVAVDVISEGVDIPALQVGSFGRLTGSHIVWLQQLGRLLRPDYAPGYDLETRAGRLAAIAASKKPKALLIDHIGGFIHPGLGAPDKPRVWSLDRREARASKESDPGDIPNKVCTNTAANDGIGCWFPYPRIYRKCPKCGFAPEPASRAAPEHVDGDLRLLDAETLAVLRGLAVPLDVTREQHDAQQLAKGARPEWLGRHWRAYEATSTAQTELRDAMDRWAGRLHAQGQADHEIQRAFYLGYGVDVLTAQGLDAREATALTVRVLLAIDGTVNGR